MCTPRDQGYSSITVSTTRAGPNRNLERLCGKRRRSPQKQGMECVYCFVLCLLFLDCAAAGCRSELGLSSMSSMHVCVCANINKRNSQKVVRRLMAQAVVVGIRGARHLNHIFTISWDSLPTLVVAEQQGRPTGGHDAADAKQRDGCCGRLLCIRERFVKIFINQLTPKSY